MIQEQKYATIRCIPFSRRCRKILINHADKLQSFLNFKILFYEELEERKGVQRVDFLNENYYFFKLVKL
jgi:hypothetical protein